MCSSMLSLKFFVYSNKKANIARDQSQRMRQVVAYKRLALTVRPKKWSRSLTGGGRLLEVPTVRL